MPHGPGTPTPEAPDNRDRTDLTVLILLLWWLQQLNELHVDVDLHSQDQADFEQHQLQLADACRTRKQT